MDSRKTTLILGEPENPGEYAYEKYSHLSQFQLHMDTPETSRTRTYCELLETTDW